MFQVVISQPNLSSIIAAFSNMKDDIKIQIAEDGLKIEAVDAANVCMAFLKAPASAFEIYKATNGEIALDLMKLSSLTSGKDNVSLTLDEESHKLNIQVGRAKYSMSLLDPSAIKKPPRIPQLDLPAAITMSGSDLREAITYAGKVSDHVVIEQHEKEFKVSAKGDIDSFEMPFLLSELTGIRQGESRALFSLDYLQDISKVAAKCLDVHIETGIDYPMRIAFKLGEIDIQYLLAPRIEET